MASRAAAFVLRRRLQKPKRFGKRRIFGQPQKGVRMGETLAKRQPCSSRCFTAEEGQFVSRAPLRPSGVKGAALHALVPLPCSKGTAGRGPSGGLNGKGCHKHQPLDNPSVSHSADTSLYTREAFAGLQCTPLHRNPQPVPYLPLPIAAKKGKIKP